MFNKYLSSAIASTSSDKKRVNEMFDEVCEEDCDPKASKNVKLLILGSLGSGKSTLLKQVLCAVSNEPWNSYELLSYKACIFTNIVSMTATITESFIKDGLASLLPDSSEFLRIANEINNIYERETSLLLKATTVYTSEFHKKIAFLWSHAQLRNFCFQNHRFLHIEDGPIQYIDTLILNQLKDPEVYIPSREDVLYCRTKTTGIIERQVQYNNTVFTMVDVGGGRNERKKWVHSFSQVNAIMFPVNLACYCQLCYEDDATNRMLEALTVFDEIVNASTFKETNIYLVFCNVKVFAQLIAHFPFDQFFNDYNGSLLDEFSIRLFIRNKFLAKNKNHNKDNIYSIFTNLDDCDASKWMIQDVFKHELHLPSIIQDASRFYEYFSARPTKMYEMRKKMMQYCDVTILL